MILRDGAAGVPTQALPPGDTSSEAARTRQWREVGLGAQILKDLGISSIRLLTSAKLTYVGLAGFGIEISVDRGRRRLDQAPGCGPRALHAPRGFPSCRARVTILSFVRAGDSHACAAFGSCHCGGRGRGRDHA